MAGPIEIKTKTELDAMRKAGRIAAKILKELSLAIAPGVSTGELNRLARDLMHDNGVTPTFLGYKGYPACICTSINNEIVHGIPVDMRKLKSGEVISIDLAVTCDGFIGDVAATYPVGTITASLRKLLDVTHEALWCGIAASNVGARIGDVSHAIELCARSHGFDVVRDFVGHGVGRKMHEEPPVPNLGRPGTGAKLEAGMVIALEPMVVEGGWQVQILPDTWTAVTRDGSCASHFEHTVAIEENGPEVLTLVN